MKIRQQRKFKSFNLLNAIEKDNSNLSIISGIINNENATIPAGPYGEIQDSQTEIEKQILENYHDQLTKD